ncbi:hypothetical protein H0H87_012209 [Tephrocybe sp. NHM501043]|nr:hypothetical protein H0H87_012209 [Tephrocybe sp. NHM501043]
MHLFVGVHYFLSTSLPEARVDELSHVLDRNGGIRADSIDDKSLTHLITNSNSFERWQDIATRQEAGKLAIITDKWVDKSLLLGKLQDPSFYSADPAMIFSGVVACAAELEATDLEVLSAGISALGGQWRTGLTKDVTHLFVTKPTSQKYSTALHHREDTCVKVLLPHWFDDAVRLGLSGLDTTPYEWPDPPMLRARGAEDGEITNADALKRTALRKLDSEKKSLYRTADLLFPGAPLPNGDEETLQSSAASPRGKSKNVWEGRRVLLGRSLELFGSRLEAVESEIRRAGGNVVIYQGGKEQETRAVDECDVFVTRFRSGRAYVQAIRQAKTIGTLPWVFHIHSMGTLSSPMDQLLWYPIPKRSIEGFSEMQEITVTNYTGESREYLKKLIAAMGAVFTPRLMRHSISGTKTTKAASWSIPIVNHLWLEDCFVKWRNLTPALEKYVVFPPGLDFSRQLGHRGVGRDVEDMEEEDLEILEQEDDEEENAVAVELADGAHNTVKGNEKLKRPNGVSYPLGTPGSARDAQEVQDVITLDVPMDVDLPDIQPEAVESIDKQKEGCAEEDNPPVAFRPTLTPKTTKSLAERMQDKGESTAKTRIKPRPKGKPKPPPTDTDSSSTPEIRVMKRKSGQLEVTPAKKRARTSSSVSDDEAEVTQPKKKLVRRVGEKSNSWLMEAVVVTPVQYAKKAAPINADNQEDEARKKQRRILTKSPSKQVLSSDEMEREKEAIKKGKSAHRKNTFIDDEVNAVSDDEFITLSATKGGNAQSSEEEEVQFTKGIKTKTASRISWKERPSSLEPDDNVFFVSSPKSNSKPKTAGKSRPRPHPIGKDVVELLDDEEEEASPQPRKKAPTKISTFKTRKATPPASDEEIDSLASKKLRPLTPKSKVTTPPSSEGEEECIVSKKDSKSQIMTYKSKRAVMQPESEEEVESSSLKKGPARPQAAVSKSKKAPTPPISDNGHLPSTSTSLPKKTIGKVLRSAAQPTKKGKSKQVSLDDEEDEEDVPPKRSKAKPTIKPADSLPSLTPKRTVSVVLPELSLSSKKSSPSKPLLANGLSRNESIRVTADERASTTRKATGSRPAPQAKPKPKPTPTPTTTTSPSPSPPPATKDGPDASVIINGRVKRGAAARASQKLREEIMPDVMNYQQEMRNAGKGRRSLPGLPIASSGAKKRQSTGSSSEDEESSKDAKRRRLSEKGKTFVGEDEEDGAQGVSNPTKGKSKQIDGDEGDRIKTGKANKTKIADSNTSGDIRIGVVRLMTTQVKLTDDDIKVLTKLGVKITIKASECTHLIAPHLVRTEKFICALAGAPFILTEKWITDSVAAKKLLDEHNYLLSDKTNEKKFDFVLADALSRAKHLRGTLFSKMVFYITPKVPIDIKLLKNVVTACGGQVNTQVPSLRILNANSDRYIISCPADIAIWRPIASAHPVYTHELILTSALKQEIDWNNEKYRVLHSHQS